MLLFEDMKCLWNLLFFFFFSLSIKQLVRKRLKYVIHSPKLFRKFNENIVRSCMQSKKPWRTKVFPFCFASKLTLSNRRLYAYVWIPLFIFIIFILFSRTQLSTNYFAMSFLRKMSCSFLEHLLYLFLWVRYLTMCAYIGHSRLFFLL